MHWPLRSTQTEKRLLAKAIDAASASGTCHPEAPRSAMNSCAVGALTTSFVSSIFHFSQRTLLVSSGAGCDYWDQFTTYGLRRQMQLRCLLHQVVRRRIRCSCVGSLPADGQELRRHLVLTTLRSQINQDGYCAEEISAVVTIPCFVWLSHQDTVESRCVGPSNVGAETVTDHKGA